MLAAIRAVQKGKARLVINDEVGAKTAAPVRAIKTTPY
jgi:hypothetical protein